MGIRMKIFVVTALTCIALTPPAVASDWPQFQGPTRDGVSPETGLARSWGEGGPPVLWTFGLGEGFAGPAVRDAEVYILDRVEDKQDVMRCLDLNTGKELWNYAYDAPGSVSHNGSRTAPTVDENNVYSVGPLGHFYCIDRKTHQPVWHKNLLDDFGVKLPGWGVVQSPSLYKDLVIVAPQSADAYVAAFNKNTGEVVWKSPSLGEVGYTTPVVTTLGGVDQVVMIGASTKGKENGQVAGLSIEDGKMLWAYYGFHCFIPIPYPTILPGDRLFVTGGYNAGSAMIQVSQTDGTWAVSEVFRTDAVASQIQQPLFYQDHLYVNSNSNEREDGMMCLTLDGQMKWKTGAGLGSTTFERGPLMLADGMIIVLDGKKGNLHLVEPSPEAFKQLAEAPLFKGKEMWAPMALSDGKLLVRNQTELRCLNLKGS